MGMLCALRKNHDIVKVHEVFYCKLGRLNVDSGRLRLIRLAGGRGAILNVFLNG